MCKLFVSKSIFLSHRKQIDWLHIVAFFVVFSSESVVELLFSAVSVWSWASVEIHTRTSLTMEKRSNRIFCLSRATHSTVKLWPSCATHQNNKPRVHFHLLRVFRYDFITLPPHRRMWNFSRPDSCMTLKLSSLSKTSWSARHSHRLRLSTSVVVVAGELRKQTGRHALKYDER